MGGLLTCIADDGEILSTDKWMWSQWRAVWVFSGVYTQLGRETRWLDRARELIEFCRRGGWDENAGGWALVVDRAGRILRGQESIYTDAFAVYGLVEYHRASGDSEALNLAMRTADAALLKIAGPRDALPHFPYTIPAGGKSHGIPMIWSLILAELGTVANDDRYLRVAAEMADEIFRDFYRPSRDLLLEFVRIDGSELPPPEGTAVVPGHAIEEMWFQIQLAALSPQPARRNDECVRLILRHLEIGWDHQRGGGIRLAVDAAGRDVVGWRFADAKLWWPQTEALYAVLLAWERSGNAVFLEWYERIWQLCLDHYVDWQNGEWRQKLDRDFKPLVETVALPVKDPFHLPRSLLLQLELLDRLANQNSSAGPATVNH
jgi:N-acylglucosamine 2-epimerase